jgi:hypothetical protein
MGLLYSQQLLDLCLLCPFWGEDPRGIQPQLNRQPRSARASGSSYSVFQILLEQDWLLLVHASDQIFVPHRVLPRFPNRKLPTFDLFPLYLYSSPSYPKASCMAICFPRLADSSPGGSLSLPVLLNVIIKKMKEKTKRCIKCHTETRKSDFKWGLERRLCRGGEEEEEKKRKGTRLCF